MNESFTITKEVSYLELWEMIWGSDGAGITYWCDKIRTPDGKAIALWKKDEQGNLVGNPQSFKVYDYEGEEWHEVSLEDLAEAFRHADRENLTHCGNYAIVDFEGQDACNGDTLIQLAIWKEVIYG